MMAIVVSWGLAAGDTIPAAASAPVAGGGQRVYLGNLPPAVTSNRSVAVGAVRPAAGISIGVELKLRNWAGLDRTLLRAATPGTLGYGHYLTQARVNQLFDPTVTQQAAVAAWLQSQGLTVTRTFSNHLLVMATGTASRMDSAFHTSLARYRGRLVGGRVSVYYAPSIRPSVPSKLAAIVQSVTGLDDASFAVSDTMVGSSVERHFVSHASLRSDATLDGNLSGYFPSDFRKAYHVPAGDTGSGQTVGIVMWCDPPSDNTLKTWGRTTGSAYPTRSVGSLVVTVEKGAAANPGDQEASDLDVEAAAGLAPDATIHYFEAQAIDGSCPADTTGGDETSLEEALEDAGTSKVKIITNSWTDCEDPADTLETTLDPILAANSLTGHDFLFSSGDSASYCAGGEAATDDPLPEYPSSSPYVTSVGGTSFGATCTSSLSQSLTGYPRETAWCYDATGGRNNSKGIGPCDGGANATCPVGSGGGYSQFATRPAWQLKLGAYSAAVGKCKQKGAAGCRGYPDVSASGDPDRGGLYVDENSGDGYRIGGTGLASPLWAGMLADVSQYLAGKPDPAIGFVNPLLYKIANGYAGTVYTSAFNQVDPDCSGDAGACTNGQYFTSASWNPVTGLGSPNVANLETAIDTVDNSSNLPPVPLNVTSPTIAGKMVTGQKLTETHGTWTHSPNDYLYQWEDCDGSGAGCSAIHGATAQIYVLASFDIGHTLRVEEKAGNSGGDSAQAISAATTMIAGIPVPSSTNIPVISGTTTVGSTLTEKHASWTNVPTHYAYQWEDCDAKGSECALIKGGTVQKYVLAPSNFGLTIRLIESAGNAGGQGKPATSAPTTAVRKVVTKLRHDALAPISKGSKATLSGLLYQPGPTANSYYALEDATLKFTLGGQSCSAATASSGVATCTIGKVSAAKGKQTLKIVFAGTGTYAPATLDVTVTVK